MCVLCPMCMCVCPPSLVSYVYVYVLCPCVCVLLSHVSYVYVYVLCPCVCVLLSLVSYVYVCVLCVSSVLCVCVCPMCVLCPMCMCVSYVCPPSLVCILNLITETSKGIILLDTPIRIKTKHRIARIARKLARITWDRSDRKIQRSKCSRSMFLPLRLNSNSNSTFSFLLFLNSSHQERLDLYKEDFTFFLFFMVIFYVKDQWHHRMKNHVTHIAFHLLDLESIVHLCTWNSKKEA